MSPLCAFREANGRGYWDTSEENIQKLKVVHGLRVACARFFYVVLQSFPMLTSDCRLLPPPAAQELYLQCEDRLEGVE